ncbi:MAG: phosphoribosylanthranilate isomerase [Pseudomonadales bacterium]
MRTRIKICGITTVEDLDCAVSSGADAVGFNLYPPSPRAIDIETARKLVSSLPPLVSSVGLFVNQDPVEVRTICEAIGFDLVQFHGDESDAECASLNKPFIKAVRIGDRTDVLAVATDYPSCRALLLDTRVEGMFGGTGTTFDWTRLIRQSGYKKLSRPLFLAGGLTPENVRDAIRIVQPYAVDVSTGVESAPGKKDHARIKAFVDAVRQIDEELQ